MDPKQQATQLDPKLKEMYDRIIALNVPLPSAGLTPPTSPAAPTQSVAPLPTAPIMSPTPPPTPQPSTPSLPITTQVAPKLVAATPQKAPTSFIATASSKQMSSNKFMPLLLVIGGIVFFLAYTIFWVKFFNFPLPFLPF